MPGVLWLRTLYGMGIQALVTSVFGLLEPSKVNLTPFSTRPRSPTPFSGAKHRAWRMNATCIPSNGPTDTSCEILPLSILPSAASSCTLLVLNDERLLKQGDNL